MYRGFKLNLHSETTQTTPWGNISTQMDSILSYCNDFSYIVTILCWAKANSLTSSSARFINGQSEFYTDGDSACDSPLINLRRHLNHNTIVISNSTIVSFVVSLRYLRRRDAKKKRIQSNTEELWSSHSIN
jgi:hypothetical protein